jgi:hypothetical protein
MKLTVRPSSDGTSDVSVFPTEAEAEGVAEALHLASRARRASEGRGITYTLKRRTAPS